MTFPVTVAFTAFAALYQNHQNRWNNLFLYHIKMTNDMHPLEYSMSQFADSISLMSGFQCHYL